jgi:iron complex outermembrane receptor protein
MNRYRLASLLTLFLALTIFSILIPSPAWAQTAPADDETDQTLPPQKQIIEELTVTGKAPVTQPISTVTLLPKVSIEKLLSRNLGDIISLTPGVTVSEGQKAESSINLRGLSSKRITLMVDGVPIYEPYFNSFDLKTFSTANVESLKVIKGANSVLYGANTLGGVIDITTQRPSQPFLKLKGLLSENKSSFLSGMGGASLSRFAFLANFAWDKSDGFKYEKNGQRTLRSLSDFNRLDWGAKMYYHPTEASELMAEVLVTDSNYGVPPSTIPEIKARYWVFDDWKRLQTNLGYSSPFLGDGTFKARGFYVHHFNVLQDYNNPALAVKRWESTYKNSTFGGNITGEKPFGERNTLKFGLHAIVAEVQQQGDVGDDWEVYNRTILSAGLEDHFMLSEKWKLVGGLGIDHLKKHNGDTVTRFNPIFGLRFSATPWMDTHLSFSMKSRFPSMKSLYSSKGGNPDLLDELGRSIELGLSWRKGIDVQASVFFNRYDDLIQSYRGLEGYKFEQNLGRAEIKGFEISLGKTRNQVTVSANYTFLDARDIDTNLKLDYTPDHQVGLFASVGEIHGFTLSAWLSTVSSSTTLLGTTPPFSQLAIDGYTLVNVVLSKKLAWFTLLLKAENLADAVYFSEPGFPMKGRTISFGIDFDLKKYR